jgi:hypothetical protein
VQVVDEFSGAGDQPRIFAAADVACVFRHGERA